MLPLLLIPVLIPYVCSLPAPSFLLAQPTIECHLTPDSPPKVYKWTPTHPVNLWEYAGRFQGDLVGRPSQVVTRDRRCVLREGVDYWPGGVVPMDIKGEGFGWMDLNIIKKALSIIEEKTCIRFPKRQHNHTSYVELRGDLGYGECWSYLGMVGGNQTLSLGEGCVNLHHVLHEVCHALGMVHQHSAPDRDDYITIHWENIDPDFTEWFDKYSWYEYTDFGLGYDYYSVMHYSDHIASFNGKPTLSAKDPNVKIEERTTLSEKDIKKLNMMYCSGNDFFNRRYNYRGIGGYIVDLVEGWSALSRHALAAGAALCLLIATSVVGRWVFAQILATGNAPATGTEDGTAPEKPPMEGAGEVPKKVLVEREKGPQ